MIKINQCVTGRFITVKEGLKRIEKRLANALKLFAWIRLRYGNEIDFVTIKRKQGVENENICNR